MSTIKDVAKLAGVSVGTVSNYLNNKENITDDKVKSIRNAIDKLGYTPNYMAQSLIKQKNKMIGIVLPDLNEPYNDIYKGIVEHLEMKNYITVLKLTHDNIVLEDKYLNQLVKLGAVGVIIASCEVNNIEKYKKLKKRGINFVFLERKMGTGDFQNILFENKELVYDITKSITDKNEDADIKLILGSSEFSNEKDCEEGYLFCRSGRKEDIVNISGNDKETVFNRIYSVIMNYKKVPDYIITSSVTYARICVEVCNVLNISINIHALAGEKWYMTEVVKNVTLYGRNAIMMGKTASKELVKQIDGKNISENSTLHIKSKQNYSVPRIVDCKERNIKLKALVYQCDASDALKKIAASYKNQCGVEVQFEELGYRELREVINKNGNEESSEYDIYMIDIPWIGDITSKDYLVDMKGRVVNDRLIECYPTTVKKAFYKYDIGVHTLPIIGTTQVLFYRTDIFSNPDIKKSFSDKYGFELMPPSTWSSFNKIAEFFDPEYNKKSPFRYGTAASALEPIGLMNEFLPRQWAFKGRIVDRWGEVDINSEENINALNNLVETFKHSPKGNKEYFWDEIFEMLLKGEIPMAQGFASHYQTGRTRLQGNNYAKYIGCVPMPGRNPMIGGWALGINKNSKNIDESYNFIKWNLNDKVGITNMRLCGCVPTKTVFQDDTLKLSYPWLNMVTPKIDLGSLREEIIGASGKRINTEIIERIISKGIKNAIYEKESSKEVLDKLKDELSKIISEN